jgi:hypothetical protein
MLRIANDFIRSICLSKEAELFANKAHLLICRFLVIANGMAACYSLLQGARCMVSILTGGVLISRPMAWAIFSCDQASIYRFVSVSLYRFLVAVSVFFHVCYLSLSSGYCSDIISKYFEGRCCCSVALEHLTCAY